MLIKNYVDCQFGPCLVSRGTESLIEEAQEKPKSEGPLVQLHAKLVTVLWIVMGLDMKSIKPLTLFDTKVMMCFLIILFIDPVTIVILRYCRQICCIMACRCF